MPIKLKLHVIRALYYWSKFFFSATDVTAFGRDWFSACTRVAFLPSPFSHMSRSYSASEQQWAPALHQPCLQLLWFCFFPLHLFALFIAGLQQNIGMSSTWQQKEETSLHRICVVYVSMLSALKIRHPKIKAIAYILTTAYHLAWCHYMEDNHQKSISMCSGRHKNMIYIHFCCAFLNKG